MIIILLNNEVYSFNFWHDLIIIEYIFGECFILKTVFFLFFSKNWINVNLSLLLFAWLTFHSFFVGVSLKILINMTVFLIYLDIIIFDLEYSQFFNFCSFERSKISKIILNLYLSFRVIRFHKYFGNCFGN